jgi:hypothetical protein
LYEVIAMKNARVKNRLALLLVLCLSLTLFSACDFATGVGDPATAKVDRELEGYWFEESGSNVHVLVAKARKDGKTYDFEWLFCEGTLAEPTKVALSPLVGQAWLTEIEGARFVTAKFERLPEIFAAKLKEAPYMVLKLQRADETLTLTKLNAKTEAFAQAKTPDDMELAIKRHLDDTTAYDGMSKLNRSTAEAVKKVLELAKTKKD